MNSKRFKRKLRKIKKQGEQYKKIAELEAEYGEYFPAKKERKVSNIMLAVSVAAIMLYTIASFVLQFYAGLEISSTLTTLYYAFWTSEIFLLAGIRTSKVIKGHNDFGD